MGAFVDYKFSKGFLLDEERIRKINEIVLTRGQQLGDECAPTYKIYRADTFTYTTKDIQQVLNEDNADWQRVTRLIIEMNAGDSFAFELDFGEEETKLHIEGQNRDTVFLLFSELRQYLSNEVNIIRPLVKPIIGLLLGILACIVLASFVLAIVKMVIAPTTISTETALQSQDIVEKLNFLIEKEVHRSGGSYWQPMVMVIVTTIIAMVVSLIGEERFARLIERLYPSRVFLLGKELERHAKRQSLRHNILWGVIISFIVGVIGSAFVWLITK